MTASMRVAISLILTLLVSSELLAQDPRVDGWVVLPAGEYRALRARAFPAAPDPAPPPADATVTRIDYDLRASNDTVSGEARLAIDVLKDGWVKVPVPSGMLVREARLDGRPTPLIDGGPPSVLVSRAGRSLLTLDIVIPLSTSGGTESFTLPPAASGLCAATLAMPRTGVDLSVGGGLIAQESAADGETRWVVYATPARPLTFAWKRKAEDRRATLPLRTRARVAELVVLGEETSQITASVRLEIVQGTARDVVVALPQGLSVNHVAGATVADWTHTPGSLTVTLLEPVATETSFVVSAEARTPREGALNVPLVRIPAAERETGGVAVDVAGPGEIVDRQPRGLDSADVSDVGEVLAGRESPAIAAFQYRPLPGTAPRELLVSVSRYTPQPVLVATVEEARYDALLGEDGKTLVRARYVIRNNQRSFLAVALPADSALWTTSLAGRPTRPGLAPSGSLLLPLQKGTAGDQPPTFVVELVYLQRGTSWTDRGQTRLNLPAVDLPISRTGLTVHHSPRFRLAPRTGEFRVENDPGPWSPALRSNVSDAQEAAAPPPASPDDARQHLQVLIDRYRKDAGATTQGLVPVEVPFPLFGPSLFLAAELTAETRSPSVEIDYRRGGAQ